MSNSNKKPETTMVERARLGDALAALGRKIGLTNEDFTAFDKVRDRTPAEPPKFVDVAANYNIQLKSH
ncbi:hypothetical protein [Xanthomonas vasicola]|uniref:hypothetical protein n=1 Tax=Xanthomonas vasicola TaxID=56459 RepID=UPI0005313F71|nr:hypothetical protein [Xanthomonas vasicola]AZR34864.1 hypothetical protein NX08_010655 [Xanthomonas vasicola]KGR50646.1 hypothetical protein NX07_15760 [Xanthomonas vasicola]KGR58388.1 hypothetical protein NX09_00460 [Xanthomonas vasicola]KGT83748.1 hypothetical protein OC00_12100 [Xanthomonas vasicola]